MEVYLFSYIMSMIPEDMRGLSIALADTRRLEEAVHTLLRQNHFLSWIAHAVDNNLQLPETYQENIEILEAFKAELEALFREPENPNWDQYNENNAKIVILRRIIIAFINTLRSNKKIWWELNKKMSNALYFYYLTTFPDPFSDEKYRRLGERV